MGTAIQVASVPYNLAGDEAKRPNYLRGVVARNVISNSKESIGQAITEGYRNGPAIRFRSFFRWAEDPANFGQVGVPTGDVIRSTWFNSGLVEPYIPNPNDDPLQVLRASVGNADVTYWAEQWILANRPGDIDTAWDAEFYSETGRIRIDFEDNTMVLFTPAGYAQGELFLYAHYLLDDETGVFIYRIGSGNAKLDRLVKRGTNYDEFYPVIPVRLGNTFLSDDYLPAAYAQCKKAYRRATGASYDQLISSVADNESLEDIDNAYVVFGISLNVHEKACRRYIYRFFDKLRGSQEIGGQNQIRIASSGTINSEYDVRISWTRINTGVGSGPGRSRAAPGDCWIEYLGIDEEERDRAQKAGTRLFLGGGQFKKFRIYWQRSRSRHTYLDVIGAVHTNYVHGGKAVVTECDTALEDPDDSGFIIPLHFDTWRETSIADKTQMATACVFIVFNCYEVRKLRWYETGFFRFFLVIVIAIVSVLFTGGAGIGLLGAHMSVGASLGFSGMTAAIVGSVVNAMAAIVLSTLIEKFASEIGPLGQLLGAVFMLMVGNIAATFQNTGTMAINWAAFMRVENLLALTDALGKGVAGMMQADTAGIYAHMEDYAQKAREEAKKIQQAFFDEFGYGAGTIDPFMLVDSAGPTIESSDTFLTRTLMTGSELAEMSRELLYNFPEYSLTLPNAFS